MNFGDLQEAVFRFMGERDSSTRQDHLIQQVRDDLNHTLDDIVKSSPYLWHHIRESTISVVSGTSVYELNDFCVKPLSFWTEDDSAHKLDFLDPRVQDRDGSKNSNLQATSTGPFVVTWYPKTLTADSSGTDASLSNSSTALTKAAGTAWTSADEDKRIRINGEEVDLTISAYVSANAVTLDRTYLAKLSGTGTTGSGSNLSSVKWEVRPPGVYRVQLRPEPTAAQTVYYRYARRHSRMMNDDDVPDLPEDFHNVLLAGAIMRNSSFQEDNASHARYSREYSVGLRNLVQSDKVEVDMEPSMRYESPIRRDSRHSPVPVGVNFRNY